MEYKTLGARFKPDASKSHLYRPEIDGLRAFAVIAVIVNHFSKEILPGGYLGVDIFFVISGYVITSSLSGRSSTNFKDFISGFYERRVKRLVPALSAFVLIISFSICLFNSAPGQSLKTGLTSLFGFSNVYLYSESTDYFAQSTELNVFTHTWSLGVEEQFYIIFPFLIWFSGFGRQTRNGDRNLFLIVGSLSIISLIGFLWLYSVNPSAAYFLMPPRFWEMASGCLIYLGLQNRSPKTYFLEKVPPFLVLLLIVVVMFLPISFAAPSTFAVVGLTSVLIVSLQNHTAAYKCFSHPRIVYIGLISYSLYLWHWGVLSISRWTIGIHLWTVPFQVALIIILASCSYRWIETPLRKGNWFGKRWKTLLIGISILVFSSGIVYCLRKLPFFRNNLFLSSADHLQTTWWRDLNGNHIDSCHMYREFRHSNLHQCLSLERSSIKNNIAYVIGDSHARNYVSAVKVALSDFDVRYMTMGHGCAFLPIDLISTEVEVGVSCSKYVQEVSTLILEQAKFGDLVFIGQSLLNEQDHGIRASKKYFDHLSLFADNLNKKSVPVIIFDGTLPPEDPPELCTEEFWRPFPSKSRCERSYDEMLSAPSHKKFDQLAFSLSKTSNNIYYSPLRFGLCVNKTCGQYSIKGTPIWHDNGHITEKASAELGSLLRENLIKAGVLDIKR